jgi:hypothetical protein
VCCWVIQPDLRDSILIAPSEVRALMFSPQT